MICATRGFTRYDLGWRRNVRYMTPVMFKHAPSAFLGGPNARNIRLQDQCWTDFTEHIGIIYDPIALQDVMNALGPNDPNFHPACSWVWPIVSG